MLRLNYKAQFSYNCVTIMGGGPLKGRIARTFLVTISAHKHVAKDLLTKVGQLQKNRNNQLRSETAEHASL